MTQQHGNDRDWFVALVSVKGETASGKKRNYTEVMLTTRIDLLARATTETGATDSRLGFDPVMTHSLTDAIRREAASMAILRGEGVVDSEGATPLERGADYSDSESDTDECFRYLFRGYEMPPTAAQPRIRVPDVGRMTEKRLADIVDEYVLTSPGDSAFVSLIPTLAPTNWIARGSTAVPSDMSLEVARAVREGRTTGTDVSRRMEQYRRATAETGKSAGLGVQPPWMAKLDDERRKQEVARKRGRNSSGVSSAYGSDNTPSAAQTRRPSSRDPLEEDQADEEDEGYAPSTPPLDAETAEDESAAPPVAKARRGGRRPRDESLFEGRVNTEGEALMRGKRVTRQTSMFRILSTQNAPQSATAPTENIEDAVSHRPHTREPCVKFDRALVCFAGKTSHSDAHRIGLVVGAKRGLRKRCDELGRLAREGSIPFGMDPMTLLGPVETLRHTSVCIDARTGIVRRVSNEVAGQLRAALLSVE